MAAGDVTFFNQALSDLANKIWDWDSDTINIGIVNNTTVPSKTTAAPHWGGTGTTNFAANQVGTGGTSYTGPITLGSRSQSLSGNTLLLNAAKVGPLAQDASGFTTGYYGIIYSNTDANKRAIAFVDLGGPVSLVSGPLEIRWNGVDGTSIVAQIAN